MGVDGTAAGSRPPDLRPLLDLLVADLDHGFEELVRAYQGIVYSILLRACAHPPDAEDLTAQTFLRAYTALLGYGPDRIRLLQPRAWLATIALNTWRNAVRDRTRRPLQTSLEWPDDLPSPGDGVEQIAERNDDRRRLAALVARLSETQRIAVVLRFVCDFSIVEIAQVLGCPAGTVKSHISRGLRRLRAGYAESTNGRPAGTVPVRSQQVRVPLVVRENRRPLP